MDPCPRIMDPWEEILQTIRRELFTAVLGDVLDAGGMTQQFLPPRN